MNRTFTRSSRSFWGPASILVLLASIAFAAPPALVWRTLARGVEYAEIDVATGARFHVVRIDPASARLRAVMASAQDGRERTTKRWCDERKLVAAINLGMFLTDRRSNVGYARAEGHVNQKRWHPQYKSLLVWGPKDKSQPAAQLLDLDRPGARELAEGYENAIQNLRLIKAPGQSVWSAQPRRWSESAVAIDARGHVLLVFTRTRLAMAEFNQLLLGLPLGVVAAMHVEGGSPASFCVRGADGFARDLSGVDESGFFEHDEAQQEPIPNLLAVEATAAK